jgi:hypothetical protein
MDFPAGFAMAHERLDALFGNSSKARSMIY